MLPIACRWNPATISLALVLGGGLTAGTVPLLATDSTFDQAFKVSGPVRIELNNASGNVEIRGGPDGKVRVQGRVIADRSLFGKSEKNVQEVLANPPIEQRGDTIRVGKNASWLKNVSIEYTVEVPHDTEIDAELASGGITIDNVRGPVKANSASGYVHAYRVDRDTQLGAASGSIDASSIGGILRVSSASGGVTLADVKGEIKVTAVSGSIQVKHPGERVEASTASGEIEVQGARNDLKVRGISGGIRVSGDPSASRIWDLKTVSGGVDLRVPAQASFLLSAESTSGNIRTEIPVILEEQGKHSLRAHVGSSSGRIEVHTISGGINLGGN